MNKIYFTRVTTMALVSVILSMTFLPPVAANADEKTSEVRLAAAFQLPQLPGLAGPAADWQQWDSFFTFVVKRFGQDISGELRDSLAEAFLDSRYGLTDALARFGAGQNPVPQLFLDGWSRLSPIIKKALPALPKETVAQYVSFISAADQLAALGPQGSQLGLLSPDALRGMARLLEPTGAADPIAYNLNVDNALRNLLGFGAAIAAPAPGTRQSRLRRLPPSLKVLQASLPSLRLGVALAAQPDVKKLNAWVPDEDDLQRYLLAVRSLLTTLSDKVKAKSELTEEHKPLYRHIVLTAAWQESCWRQFIKKGKSLAPLASASGDVGLMQVNRNTWRNLYDLKRLGADIEYNGNAGGEILYHYLTHYALRKNEHKQKGGNLARATYSAYNGGPSQLTRYRAAKQNPQLKKIDEAFWDKFQAVSAGRELEVKRCYGK
ncbi:MAG: transglycosylase SLT domain-containing protein [Candidatus Binatia bacterium]